MLHIRSSVARIPSLRLVLAGAVFIVPIACGSGSSSNGVPEGPADASVETGTSTDASPQSDAAGGYVSFINYDPSFASYGGLFVATFWSSSLTDSCTTSVVGACTVRRDCNAADGGSSPLDVQAGTLTVGGSSLTDASVPWEARHAYQRGTPSALFAENDRLSVSATGADVPAFEQSIVGPGRIELQSPSLPDAGALSISPQSELPFTWSGGQPDTKVVVTITGNDGTKTASIACEFDASTGHATVPAEAMQAMTGQTRGVLSVAHARISKFTAGAYALSLSASQATFKAFDVH
jgi:hypothetical protein